MAPGLNGRQTGTVPKNKLRSCESQPHRLTCEPFVQSPLLEWEQMSELGREKNYSKKKSCTSRSETDADSLRYELGRSRSSTMTSQNGNREGCSHDSFPGKINVPDRKQVANKLSQIKNYVQQTAALLSSLKASDSPDNESQCEKLSAMLEELKDSEKKLSELLEKMDNAESKIDYLLMDATRLQGNNNVEAEEEEEEEEEEEKEEEEEEEEMGVRSRESKKKLEALQRKKQDLLKLQEKAKKQLEEAQAEQSRLVARASSINQELSASKVMDLNVQQLSQRLKSVQEIYSTRNQIADNLNENQKINKLKTRCSEDDQTEMSDTETDFQLVADKMEELDAMKAQLSQIQKIMASINAIQNSDQPSNILHSEDDNKEETNQTSCFAEGNQNVEDGNNLIKLEQAKSKLNHLTQLLEIVHSAQNTNGLSPSYLKLVSTLVNEEANSYPESPTPPSSIKSPQRNCEEISVQSMQVMTKELEETTAAMKEERDRLLAARQELQDIAKRLPLNKSEVESASPDFDSESEPPCLKPAVLDCSSRDDLNGLTEADQSSNCNEGHSYVVRSSQSRNRQRGMWNSSSPGSNCTTQESRSKNESLPRGTNQSSRGGSRVLGRDQTHWSPSPSISFCNDRPSALTESQQQLEMSGNLCEMMLSETHHRGFRPNEISLHEMFSQHQLLTRTVTQCSQLLWLQQKQIIELRNAIMLQCGFYPGQQLPPLLPNQSHINIPAMSNPSFLSGPSISNVRQVPPVTIQQQQNFLHPLHQNVKLNGGEMQNVHTPHQDFSEQYLEHGNGASLNFPDSFGCDLRSGNFNRINPSSSNTNHTFHQNLSSGFNNRGPNGINSLVPEDSGALNNQVPPGNRANNYWDNFRSYSRQNLLSNTKSNEDSELSKRCLGISSQERPLRDLTQSSLHNNQTLGGLCQQPAFSYGNCETASSDQFLLPPSQNTRTSHHSQVVRSCSVEPQNQRNSGKNETKHQDNDSRNFNSSAKNEGSRGGRSRNPDSGVVIRSVRNDVSHGFRNSDNINSTRNFVQLVRDIDNEEVTHGNNNNKKRGERSSHRNEGLETLNNRSYHNTSLWDNIYAEVSTFIRANESRPHFLLQLFRDLQLVNTDSLRQRVLVSIQETASANNLTERTSNVSGGNVNIIGNRNNIRENRSNLNRNLAEDPDRIDELFYHLRENQNTIRQNIGMSSYILNGNLENPNISNIRDFVNSRNNLENEGLRDLRTYFEANLCNFGHNSTLENPNLSNIRENLTRRVSGMSEWENVHPKNVYLSIYDNSVEPRRREPYRNLELGNDYMGNDISRYCENIRESNNLFESENNFEGAVGARSHFQQESRPGAAARFPDLDTGENFGRSRQLLRNGNDSGIDINFNSEERKRSLAEGDASINDGSVKSKKNGAGDVEGAAALPRRDLKSDWDRSTGGENSLDSSLKVSRKDVSSPFIPICQNSFFHCRAFQQSDNGDLAEADQSRNEETSGAESDSGFINAQIVDTGIRFSPDRNIQSSENNFPSQNIPEAERNFTEVKNCENDCNKNGEEPEGTLNFSNSASKQEGGSHMRLSEGGECHRKNDALDGLYYQVNVSSSSESTSLPKSGLAHQKKSDESAERESLAELKNSSSKNSTNKLREGSFSQGKCSGTGSEELENRKTDTDSVESAVDVSGSRDSVFSGNFRFALDKSLQTEKGNTSPEADSDWEWGVGLDQVPTRLNDSGSSRKSDDSNGSVP